MTTLTTGRLRLRRWRDDDIPPMALINATPMSCDGSAMEHRRTTRPPRPEVMPAVEIGWRLGRRHWGHGMATEAARAVLDFGFTDGGLDRIISIHQTGNDASGRIIQKLGMQLDRETTDVRGRPVRVYAISRDERAAGSPTGPR